MSRKIPSFSHRPGFPQGLQVLLVDADHTARADTESKLNQFGYLAIPCDNHHEAAAKLSKTSSSYDVMLVDASCLSSQDQDSATLLQAAKSMPLVLMSSCCTPSDVLSGINLGAVDYLEKPLSDLKLKNIWQHTVRKMLSRSPSPHLGPKGSSPRAAAAAATAPHDDTLSGAACQSAAGGAESGSNASSSEAAMVKNEPEYDLWEISSFQEALGLDCPMTSSLSGLASGLAGLFKADSCMENSSDSMALLEEARRSVDSATTGATTNLTAAVAQPGRLERSQSLPHQPTSSSTARRNNSKPAIGHPAGQMPALPNVPGMAWGLPTNPVQIIPRFSPMMPPPMAWPMPPMMPPAMFNMPPTPPATPAPLVTPTPTPAPEVSSIHTPIDIDPLSDPLLLSALADLMDVAMPEVPLSESPELTDLLPLPLPAPVTAPAPMPPTFSACPSPALPASPRMVPAGCSLGGSCSGSGSVPQPDLIQGLVEGRTQNLPIGLKLHKSASLLNMITESLKQGTCAMHVG